MAGFLFRLETEDGSPAEPPTLSSAVPNWREGDTIHLGKRAAVVALRDEDGDTPPALVVEPIVGFRTVNGGKATFPNVSREETMADAHTRSRAHDRHGAAVQDSRCGGGQGRTRKWRHRHEVAAASGGGCRAVCPGDEQLGRSTREGALDRAKNRAAELPDDLMGRVRQTSQKQARAATWHRS